MLILMLATLTVAPSCGSPGSDKAAAAEASEKQTGETGHVVDPEGFAKKIAELRESGREFVLIDARTPGELESTGYLEGAVNLDWNNGRFQEEFKALDREVPVLVYCRSGGRSGHARELMVENGFLEVYDLDGGIKEWLDQDLPVVHIQEQPESEE